MLAFPGRPEGDSDIPVLVANSFTDGEAFLTTGEHAVPVGVFKADFSCL